MINSTRVYLDYPFSYVKGQIFNSAIIDKQKYIVTKVFKGTIIEKIKKCFNPKTKITYYIDIIAVKSL